MSKFIDKLNRLTRAESSSLGFTRGQSAPPVRKIQLVANLAEENKGDITGADAVLVGVSGKGIDIESLPEIPGDIPWGGWLRDEQKKLKGLKENGCDFVVFPAGTPLATVENTDTGKILEIDPEISDSLLRAVNELPVDAVLVSFRPVKGGSLTWQDLMLFQRFAGFLNKPLLACIPPTVTGSELEALWEAGVKAVVVDANKDDIAKLRKAIDKSEFASTQKREKVAPVLYPQSEEID